MKFSVKNFFLVITIFFFTPQLYSTTAEKFTIHTLYGNFQVTEPVLINLFQSPVMERIKHVRQYGVMDYIIKQPKEYTRYDHCVGVWALLRKFGASLEEQIAGLLHDVSHTVFSHAGDYLFHHKSINSSYQDDIHEWYLKQQKVDQLLAQHNIPFEAVLHKSGTHTMLEQDLPDICADRLEYNLQAGVLTGMLCDDAIARILKNICFEQGRWFFVNQESAKQLAMVSLFNTEHVWGSPLNFVMNTWISEALQQSLKIGLLTFDDIHFSTDVTTWDKLWRSNDPIISQYLLNIVNYQSLITITASNEAIIHAKGKFRGIDPWIKTEVGFKRLTELDADYKKEYERVKQQVSQGWGIKLEGTLTQEYAQIESIVA